MKRFISCIVMFFVVAACFAQMCTYTASVMSVNYYPAGKRSSTKIVRGNWTVSMDGPDLYIKGGAYYGKVTSKYYRAISDISDETRNGMHIGSAKAMDGNNRRCGIQIAIESETDRIAIIIIYKDKKIIYLLDKN